MEDNREFASDNVFRSVYRVSEDMLRLVHKIVSEHARCDIAFRQMAAALQDVNDNLKKHILSNKKFNATSKNKTRKKIAQSKVLINLCIGYANKCKKIADELVDLTEKLEEDKKMQAIINNLIMRLEEETRNLKEQNQEEEDSEDDPEDCD
jgi:uncharacterized membrane-anchored protein YjiN (DUF445 family)